VPEGPVDKYRDSTAKPGNVGLARHTARMQPPATHSGSPQGSTKRDLWFGIAGLDPAHERAALRLTEKVSHRLEVYAPTGHRSGREVQRKVADVAQPSSLNEDLERVLGIFVS
jgi:hypothetical protein